MSTFAGVINKSFQEGVFPEQMKTVRVVPMHKDDSKQNAHIVTILYILEVI